MKLLTDSLELFKQAYYSILCPARESNLFYTETTKPKSYILCYTPIPLAVFCPHNLVDHLILR